MADILASFDDINANLDGTVISATNTDPDIPLLQISVARIVRGYLSRVINNTTLQSWNAPGVTPEIIREIAGKLIAAQHYFNRAASTSLELPDDNFAQRLYDEAMALLRSVVSGEILIPGVLETPTEGITSLDFFPIDDTDRAFTLNMRLD